jgi:hypothetical protein
LYGQTKELNNFTRKFFEVKLEGEGKIKALRDGTKPFCRTDVNSIG